MATHKLQISRAVSKPTLRWLPDKPRCLEALRAGYSAGGIARAYSIPEHVVLAWRREEKIPRSFTPRPTPQVGQKLV